MLLLWYLSKACQKLILPMLGTYHYQMVSAYGTKIVKKFRNHQWNFNKIYIYCASIVKPIEKPIVTHYFSKSPYFATFWRLPLAHFGPPLDSGSLDVFFAKNGNMLIVNYVMQTNCLIPKSFSPFYSLIPKSWAETHGLRWHCVGWKLSFLGYKRGAIASRKRREGCWHAEGAGRF